MKARSLPPILRSPAFSTTAARQAGVQKARLRRSDLVAPFHAARVPGDLYDGGLRARCLAYRAVMPSHQCFSHQTAAWIYGLPVPSQAEDDLLHVGTAGGGRAPKGAGVVGHRLAVAASELRTVSGLRVPQVAEVWCELAAVATLNQLVVVGDAIVRRKDPLGSVDELRFAAAQAVRRPGAKRLREAIELVRARTDSPMETRLRLALVTAGLPEPEVNYFIALPDGRTAHLDLAYPARRLALEYDGEQHRTDARQYRIDIDRLWAIEAAGWRVIRINSNHMSGGAAVAVARIRAALAQRGPDTP